MNRREFIAALGGAAAWPLAASAQQGNRVRRIGVLMPYGENDPAMKLRVTAFTQAIAGFGWIDGRNLRMDLRWYGDDINRLRTLAQELVSLQPDIILTIGTPATAALQRETRTIPIVFPNVGDPVVSVIVERLNRPGGNVTGFALFEPSLGGKWLELLSEIAPGLKRAAICSILTRPSHRFLRRPCCRAGWVHSRTSRSDHIGGGPKQRTGGLFGIWSYQRRRFALLRNRPGRPLASRRDLCRSHPARREAGRSPGTVSDQVRDGREPQDRHGARP
jgi:hypothetical protein